MWQARRGNQFQGGTSVIRGEFKAYSEIFVRGFDGKCLVSLSQDYAFQIASYHKSYKIMKSQKKQ